MPEMKNSRDEFTNRLAELQRSVTTEPSLSEYVNSWPKLHIRAHVLREKDLHSAPVSGGANAEVDSESMGPHPHSEQFPAGQSAPAMQEGIRYHAPSESHTCKAKGTVMADDTLKSDGCSEHSLADKRLGALEVQAPETLEGAAQWWDNLFGCCPVGRMFGCSFRFFSRNDNTASDVLAHGSGGVLGFDISDPHGVISSTLVPLLNIQQKEM